MSNDWMTDWREPTDITTALDALAVNARRVSVAERDPRARPDQRAIAWSALIISLCSALRLEVQPGPVTLGEECGWKEDGND